MKIYYLGTAAAEGIPAIFCDCKVCNEARRQGGKNLRTRSQVVIDDIIIDFPPDTLVHSHKGEINLIRQHAIFITHSHQDHWYPEDLIFRVPPYSWGAKFCLDIFGNQKVYDAFTKVTSKANADISSSIAMHFIEPFKPISIRSMVVTPLLAVHDRREQCYIYMIENQGKTLLYAHDTGILPQATLDYIKGKRFDAVSMDCTMVALQDGNNHMGIEDNHKLELLMRSLGCIDDKTKIVLSHFSHNGGLIHEEIEKKVSPYGYIVAYDGMKLEF